MKGFRLLGALALSNVTFCTPSRADEVAWKSAQEAQRYLADVLPRATRANPVYRTKADGTLSEWRTEWMRFFHETGLSPRISMFESYTQTQAGKSTTGNHEAAFSLRDVEISEFTEPADVTPDGAPSRGILFTCAKPGCIDAKWGGQVSRADKTDISVQDADTRARILSAFKFLKANSG